MAGVYSRLAQEDQERGEIPQQAEGELKEPDACTKWMANNRFLCYFAGCMPSCMAAIFINRCTPMDIISMYTVGVPTSFTAFTIGELLTIQMQKDAANEVADWKEKVRAQQQDGQQQGRQQQGRQQQDRGRQDRERH